MADKKLTRPTIKKIVDGMTARDMFSLTPPEDGQEPAGGQMAGAIFDAAAKRQGHGEAALDRVSVSDATWLSELLAESLNVGGPKVDGTKASPASAGTGDSAPS